MINLRRHDSNKYQTKAFVICDHKSHQTRSATYVNKTYLVWLMYWLLFNQHYQHRTNQKPRSWANAVFQNRGVCGQAFPSLPSSSPVISFFLLSSQLSRRTRAETLATQAKGILAGVSALYGVGDFTIDFIVIGKTLEEIKTASDKNYWLHVLLLSVSESLRTCSWQFFPLYSNLPPDVRSRKTWEEKNRSLTVHLPLP